MDKTIIIFSIMTLVNVILGTAKSILTIKASRGTAAIINAIAYGFYAMVIKQMVAVDLNTVLVVTVLANLVGVYFSMWLLDKFKKDVFWKVTVIPENSQFKRIRRELVENGLGFNEYKIYTKYGEQMALDIFSANQLASSQIKKILSEGKVKYHIQEIGNQL